MCLAKIFRILRRTPGSFFALTRNPQSFLPGKTRNRPISKGVQVFGMSSPEDVGTGFDTLTGGSRFVTMHYLDTRIVCIILKFMKSET